MKRYIGLISLLVLALFLEGLGQAFQFTLKVQDEHGQALKGVSVGTYHVRTSDDGMATLNLPEGKTSLALHLNGYLDQTVDVITSRVVNDNLATFTLRNVPPAVKKIIVKGMVTTTHHQKKRAVPGTEVKLFYSGHEISTTAKDDGSFLFEVPDIQIDNYDWVIHYYHPDYDYVDPFRFAVPKTNYIELSPNLVLRSQSDTAVIHRVYFIIYPLPWKTDQWDVLDIENCQCVVKNDKGFQIAIQKELKGVHLKIVRKGYDDIDMVKSHNELQEITSAEYIYMKGASSLKISRLQIKSAASLSLVNSRLFVMPFNESITLMWHPTVHGRFKNKWGVMMGISGIQTIETSNMYQTLGGYIGKIQSRYHLVETGSVGVRYYCRDFMLRASSLYIQGQLTWINQKPVGAFSQENFTAQRSSYSYLVPTLALGVRKNILPFMALDGNFSLSAANISSESFIFNYFGNAYPKEDRNTLINVALDAGVIFFISYQK